MLGRLIPCGGGDEIPLLKEKLLVGRRSRCDVTLKFPNISSHHCELEFLNGYWFVRDMNSRNGIKVNDIRCQSKWLLPGDILAIAKHRFEISYQPLSDAPPPDTEEDPFAQSLLEKAGLAGRRKLEPSDSEVFERSRKRFSRQLEKEEDEVEWLEEDDDV